MIQPAGLGVGQSLVPDVGTCSLSQKLLPPLAAHLSGKVLGHAGLLDEAPPGLLQPCRIVGQQPCSLQLRGHMGDLVLHSLRRKHREWCVCPMNPKSGEGGDLPYLSFKVLSLSPPPPTLEPEIPLLILITLSFKLWYSYSFILPMHLSNIQVKTRAQGQPESLQQFLGLRPLLRGKVGIWLQCLPWNLNS